MQDKPTCEFGEDAPAVSIWKITCAQPDCDHYEVMYVCADCEERYIKPRIEANTRLVCATCNRDTPGGNGTYAYLGAA